MLASVQHDVVGQTTSGQPLFKAPAEGIACVFAERRDGPVPCRPVAGRWPPADGRRFPAAGSCTRGRRPALRGRDSTRRAMPRPRCSRRTNIRLISPTGGSSSRTAPHPAGRPSTRATTKTNRGRPASSGAQPVHHDAGIAGAQVVVERLHQIESLRGGSVDPSDEEPVCNHRPLLISISMIATWVTLLRALPSSSSSGHSSTRRWDQWRSSRRWRCTRGTAAITPRISGRLFRDNT